jgi:transcriptional antiterminator RfaH
VQVRNAHGVTTIIRFGEYYPLIPDQLIEELQDLTTTGDLLPALVVGSSVTIARGTLAGSEAVITEVLPAKERVRLLLNFLGPGNCCRSRHGYALTGGVLCPEICGSF